MYTSTEIETEINIMSKFRKAEFHSNKTYDYGWQLHPKCRIVNPKTGKFLIRVVNVFLQLVPKL